MGTDPSCYYPVRAAFNIDFSCEIRGLSPKRNQTKNRVPLRQNGYKVTRFHFTYTQNSLHLGGASKSDSCGLRAYEEQRRAISLSKTDTNFGCVADASSSSMAANCSLALLLSLRICGPLMVSNKPITPSYCEKINISQIVKGNAHKSNTEKQDRLGPAKPKATLNKVGLITSNLES